MIPASVTAAAETLETAGSWTRRLGDLDYKTVEAVGLSELFDKQ